MGEIQVAHRSYSQMTSWLRCGNAYYLERVAKVPQRPSWWFVGGKAVHSATETFDRLVENKPYLLVAGEERTKHEEEIDWIWESAWENEYQDTLTNTDVPVEEWRAGGRATKAKPNKENGDWWKTAGREFLRNWVDFRITYPNWRIAELPDGRPGIEPEFNVWFGTVPVRGFIDRVFDVRGPGGEVSRVVVDLKTGARMPDTTQQTGMYASMMELAYGAEHRPPLGCFWDARKGDITVPEGLGSHSVENLTPMLEMFNRAVLDNIFIPHVGGNCNSCSVAKYCRAVSGELADTVDPIETPTRKDHSNA